MAKGMAVLGDGGGAFRSAGAGGGQQDGHPFARIKRRVGQRGVVGEGAGGL